MQYSGLRCGEVLKEEREEGIIGCQPVINYFQRVLWLSSRLTVGLVRGSRA